MSRLYRALLLLYPASFRRSFGAELCALFEERLGAARGPLEVAHLVAGSVLDVATNAAAAHVEILLQDLRFAARSLARAPGYALTTILVVAFGVGANTAAFSVADFVLVRPLPFPEPERLVRVWERTPEYSRMELSPSNYRDWKTEQRSFAQLGAYYASAMNLVGVGEPRRVESAAAEPELFRALGVDPLRGRLFSAADRDDARAVLVSHGLWQTELGGDPAVLGRTVELDGAPYEVVGIMPESFRFPTRWTGVWVPLELREDDYLDRTNNYLEVVGRLADGVSAEQALVDLEATASRLAEAFPETNESTGAHVYPLREDVSQRARLMLGALGGAALCILLLACANLTGLSLARSASHEQELAVRVAIGAGRERLVRQMVTESGVLALVGGSAGVLLAAGAVPLLTRLVPTTLPVGAQPEVDLRVLGLAAFFTTLTAVGFGVLPALRVGARGSLATLRESPRGGGGRQRLRAALVSVQVASALVLLVSCGLLTRAMWRLQETDPGFRTEGVFTVRTPLPMPRYEATEVRHELYRRIVEEVEALPGVGVAAYTTGLPMRMGGGIWPVITPDRPDRRRGGSGSASLRYVTPGYFEAMGIPLLRGREADHGDTFDREWVAVVSQSLAEREWPGRDALGQRFEIGLGERTVVGVVGDVRVRGLERQSEPQVYLPHRQVPDGGLIFYAPKDLVVESDLEPGTLSAEVREIVRRADPALPLSNVATLEQIVAGESATRRTQLHVLVALAASALLLAAVGIHGLLAFTVSTRAREIGVRLALGARPWGVARMVLRDGLVLTLLGVVPGVLVALAAGRALGALLLGVRPGDPATFGAAVAVVLATAFVGSLVPALRAVRVSPSTAMAGE